MKNTLLIILEILLCYISVTLLYKKYKKRGIFIYTIISVIALYFMILKKITILGINIPLGLANTTSIIICSNILMQNYGKETIKKYILLLIITFISAYCFIYLVTAIDSSTITGNITQTFNNIFMNSSIIHISLFISIIISVLISSKIYYIIKKIKNKIIISNIITIIITEFIEVIIFVVIAYINELKTVDLIMCIVIIDIIKTVIGSIGTIPMYIITELNNWEESNENN